MSIIMVQKKEEYVNDDKDIQEEMSNLAEKINEINERVLTE